MNLPLRPALLSFFVWASTAAFTGLHAEPGRVFPPVTPAQIAGIEAALPKQKQSPAKPRRLLVFYRTEGFVHSSIPVGLLSVKRLGESTGAFTTTASEDMAMFEPSALAGFDAVVFLNTTGLKFESPVHRQALLDFVKSGKGIAGIHAATDNFPTWPEGQALMGGVFHGHPWNAKDLSAVKIDEPAHALTQSFGGRGFWIREEIYQLKAPYSRERQRVLLSLDMSKPENARPADKIKRTDNDFAISWLRAEGKGRVFYTSLGHREDVYFAPSVLGHMFDGLRYALGDLAADDVPSVNAAAVAPALAPDDRTPLQERLPAVTAPTAARPPAAEATKADVVTSATLRALAPAARAEREAELLAILNAPGSSAAAKFVALDALSLAGTAKSVPTLSSLAASSEPGMPERAAKMLAQLRQPDAESALLALSKSLPAGARTAVIDALGSYSSGPAIQRLKAIATEPNPADARAARASLVAIATPASVTALGDLPVSPDNTTAVLAAADLVLRRDSAAGTGVAKIIRRILPQATTASHSVEALELLARIGDPQDSTLYTALIDNPQPRIRQTAVACLVASCDRPGIQALGARWAALANDTQIAALAAIRDGSGSPLITVALTGTDPLVTAAAINAAARISDVTTLLSLTPRLATAGPARDAAILALARTPSPEISTRLMDLAGKETNPALQAALVSLLGDRKVRNALPLIQTVTASAADAPRAAAFKALSDISGQGDLPLIIELVANAKKSADRRDWRKALYGAVDGNPDPAKTAALLSDALANPALPERPSFIGALTLMDVPAAAATLTGLLAAPEPAARKDVIRALGSARTPGSLQLLLKTAASTPTGDERVLAVRGCIETLPALENLTNAARIGHYRAIWAVTSTQEEKDAVIAAVRGIKGKPAEAFLKEFAPPPAPETKA